MREEDYIRKKCGSDNHFKVPEGYFEQFSTTLMQQLQKEGAMSTPKVASTRSKLLTFSRYAAAAIVCGALFAGTLFYFTSYTDETIAQQVAPAEESYSWDDTYTEDALDYAMVSNHEIVQYLSEAY